MCPLKLDDELRRQIVELANKPESPMQKQLIPALTPDPTLLDLQSLTLKVSRTKEPAIHQTRLKSDDILSREGLP